MLKKKIIKGYEKANDTTAHIILEVVDEVTLEKLLQDRDVMKGMIDDTKTKLEEMKTKKDELIETEIERIKFSFNNKIEKLQQSMKVAIERLKNLEEVITEIKKLGVVVPVKKEEKKDVNS